MKHTALSLAKYLGRKVWVAGNEDNLAEIGTLIRVAIRDEYGAEVQFKGHYDGIAPCGVFPILKTVQDLTKSDMSALNIAMVDNFQLWEDFSVMNEGKLTMRGDIEYLAYLMRLSAGARAASKSPTGYVSIFDNLPCMRWSEVFND